jgi:peptide/nickel transport system substrate-binding protein
MKKTNALMIVSIMILAMATFAVQPAASQITVPFTALTLDTPGDIDPADAYDSSSIDVIQQILEGLYTYNLSSPDMESIPQLADGMGEWSLDGLNLTIGIRTDAKWHDGTDVTATQVKWNFDRVFDFATNASGIMGKSAVLYLNDDDEAIVAETIVIDENTIRFVLNKPWTVWEKLLAFTGSCIIKPNEAYREDFISVSNYALIIGTGPFKLESITPDVETVFVSNEAYYRGAPNIKKMVYLAVDDSDTASLAMLNHEVHYGGVSPEYLDLAREDSTITIQPVKNTVTRYVQFNVNSTYQPTLTYTLRRAMSFAFNYPYHINEVEGGDDYELHTPIPDGMEFHNPDIVGLPYFNLTYARMLIINDPQYDAPRLAYKVANPWIDWSNQTHWDNDTLWTSMAINPAYKIGEFTFSRYTSGFVQRFVTVLQDSMTKIGIRIIDNRVGDWGLFSKWVAIQANKESMQLSLGGWGPDYNDPINMMEPIFKTGAAYNDMLLANATLDQMMAEYYTLTSETTPTKAERADELQEWIAVKLVPCFFFMQDGGNIMWDNEVLSNVDDMFNAFGNWYWYNVIYTPRTIPSGDDDVPTDIGGIAGFNPIFLLAALGVTAALIIRKRK